MIGFLQEQNNQKKQASEKKEYPDRLVFKIKFYHT
jgi:hypothetical protein